MHYVRLGCGEVRVAGKKTTPKKRRAEEGEGERQQRTFGERERRVEYLRASPKARSRSRFQSGGRLPQIKGRRQAINT